MIDRRRPPAAQFRRQWTLLLATAFTLIIFPLTSNADNSNYNSNPRHETVVNSDDFDAPSTPEMAPIEDVAGENTESFVVEGREELLETPNILTPSVAAEEQRDDDSSVADATVGGAATDTGTTAGSAHTDEDSELSGHQQSPAIPAVGEEGDASTAAEGAALESEDDTPRKPEPAGTDEGNDTGQEGTSQEQEAGETQDGNIQPVEETKEEVKEAKSPTANGDSEDTAASGDIVVDGYGDTHEVLGSGAPKLSIPAAVTTDDDQVGSSGPITHPVDGSAETAAAAAAATAAETLETQASAAVATTESGDNDIEASSSSSEDGEDDVGAGDDGVEPGTSYPSSIAEPTAPGGGEPQEPVRPTGPRSAAGGAAAASDVQGVRPMQAEGSHGGRGNGVDDGGDGGDSSDGGSGVVDDEATVDRAPEGSKTGSLPGGVEEDTETAPSNRSSSGGGGSSTRSSGRNEAGGHERHGGDVGQGDRGEPGGGGQGANRRDKGGGRRDDGASGGAEFPRSSPEELAQRVRDMEAELVRKLLAEEDAKSLLDM